ncbi:MAG: peptidylprolyl isomerase [Candidatus Eisenbacteria bacterium]|nr:peptidylprolyl isomerase [Candidatus Eisenbacteria bacterium]
MPRASLLAIALMTLTVLASPGDTAPARTPAPTVVTLDTAQGRIVIQLAASDAPRTCANFVKLARSGFYDGTTFHRVVEGFMIQGGDPGSKDGDPFNDGDGGPGYTVPAEIRLPHRRGSVAMARLPDSVNPRRDSNGSQFFICVADREDLDRGGYTVFGKVVSGMEVVDAIVALGRGKDVIRSSMGANPAALALIRKVTVETRPARAPAR